MRKLRRRFVASCSTNTQRHSAGAAWLGMTNTTLDSADTVYGDQYDLAVGVSFLLLSILGTIYNSILNHPEIMVILSQAPWATG